MNTFELLTDIVKEKGITNIILDYKADLEVKDKYDKVIEQLKVSYDYGITEGSRTSVGVWLNKDGHFIKSIAYVWNTTYHFGFYNILDVFVEHPYEEALTDHEVWSSEEIFRYEEYHPEMWEYDE